MIPELLELPLLPFRVGEAVGLGSVGDTLLVTTVDMVMPPLTVTIVVVTTGTD